MPTFWRRLTPLQFSSATSARFQNTPPVKAHEIHKLEGFRMDRKNSTLIPLCLYECSLRMVVPPKHSHPKRWFLVGKPIVGKPTIFKNPFVISKSPIYRKCFPTIFPWYWFGKQSNLSETSNINCVVWWSFSGFKTWKKTSTYWTLTVRPRPPVPAASPPALSITDYDRNYPNAIGAARNSSPKAKPKVKVPRPRPILRDEMAEAN